MLVFNFSEGRTEKQRRSSEIHCTIACFPYYILCPMSRAHECTRNSWTSRLYTNLFCTIKRKKCAEETSEHCHFISCEHRGRLLLYDHDTFLCSTKTILYDEHKWTKEKWRIRSIIRHTNYIFSMSTCV